MAASRILSVGHDMHSVSLMRDGMPVSDLMIVSFWSGQKEDGTWLGAIDLERTGGELERLAAADPTFWIHTTIREPDGGQTIYSYPEAKIRFVGAGAWSRDQCVFQRIGFTAERRFVS